jgi:hypothetical protein
MEQPGSSTAWNQWDDEGTKNWNMAAGAVLASAVAAGTVAFLLRRARHEEEVRTPTGFAGRALDRTREMVGDDRLDAGRDFLVKTVVPEFKPALLSILEEFQEVIDDAFGRAKKAIKNL